jgi:DNA-binding Lrp family transcriptional regulator
MESFDIDVIDLKLLDLLQTDASRSNQALAELAHISPPTCLRRIKRLRDSGLIARQVALLDSDQLTASLGHGLTAIVEVTLDRQGSDYCAAFEARVAADEAVQQCYRVSSGPDFCLVVVAQRLFTSDANVRNVKAFFSIKRSKFEPRLPLPVVKPA